MTAHATFVSRPTGEPEDSTPFAPSTSSLVSNQLDYRISHHPGYGLRTTENPQVMRIEKSCPLPRTHTRLRQAHDLWHEVQNAYPDADAFVLALNNCISAARSVTFVLQTEGRRRNREVFDPWYEEQQQAMRADTRMKWLHDARTSIQKEGDLDTHSIAKVSLLTTDASFDVADIEVDPLVGPSQAAESIKLQSLPDRIRKQAVLVVERRWTVPELPDDELLDTLGHCYGRIADVVRGAHELFGVRMQTFGGETHRGEHHREPHPSGRLPCMLPTTEMRSAYWHLGADTLIEQEMRSRTLGRDELAAVGQESKHRYGDLSRHQLIPGTPVTEYAAALHEVARRILMADGYHLTVAWLFREGTPMAQYGMTPADNPDKIVKLRALAAQVEEAGADAVVITTETWTAPAVDADDPRFALRAAERDDRTEALLTVALQRSGAHAQIISPFTRDTESGHVYERTIPADWAPAGAIVLEVAQDMPLDYAPLYRPILDVWARWTARQ